MFKFIVLVCLVVFPRYALCSQIIDLGNVQAGLINQRLHQKVTLAWNYKNNPYGNTGDGAHPKLQAIEPSIIAPVPESVSFSMLFRDYVAYYGRLNNTLTGAIDLGTNSHGLKFNNVSSTGNILNFNHVSPWSININLYNAYNNNIYILNKYGFWPSYWDAKFIIDEWFLTTKGQGIGTHTSTVQVYTPNTGTINFTLRYNIVPEVKPTCDIIFPSGTNNYYLDFGNTTIGSISTKQLPITLKNCQDVWQAKLNIAMPDSKDNKSETVKGGFLQVKNQDDEIIDLDGSYIGYIPTPNNKTLNYTIINNAENAKNGGKFKKNMYIKATYN
ncbi:hypothetical protein C0W80_18890 [Photobacterium leiognathi subsp. mandapamensis]|uniref:hypothetical protein n=1 Tax=Photobacterium leiognathi TaxID=553611 RepID=UPI000D17B7EC|nr:hypothetical protein [Photobacterium leiognathi]PSU95240.1 hypothetical protein C0W80_18890 [Photobacterium leiognathi subsp. mandapamensis]